MTGFLKKIFGILGYRINKSFQTNILSLIFFLIILSILGILIFSAVIFILFKLNLINDVSFLDNLIWNIFRLFFDQNQILNIEFKKNSFLDLFYKFSITLFGIFIFSTLIAIITNYIFDRVMELRSGRAPIKDQNHFIIFNYTNKTVPLIQEIVEGYLDQKKTIVIVDNSEANEILDTINRAIKIPKNISLIARKGYGWQSSIIEKVNLGESEKIVILNPDLGSDFKTLKEADTEVAKTLTAIRASQIWRDKHIPIISEFHSEEMSSLYNNFATPVHDDEFNHLSNNSSNLTLRNIQAKLIAQCVNTPEVSQVYDQLLGFKGSELYFIDEQDSDYATILEKAQGKNLGELNLNCKKIIILGFYYTFNQHIKEEALPTFFLNTSKDFLFFKGCGIICLAEHKTKIIEEFRNLDFVHKPQHTQLIVTKDNNRSLRVAIYNLSKDNNLSDIFEIILDLRDINNQNLEKITIFQTNDNQVNIKEQLKQLIDERQSRSWGFFYYFRYKNYNYHDPEMDYYSYMGIELVPKKTSFIKIVEDKDFRFIVRSVHPLSPCYQWLKPGDEILGLSEHQSNPNNYQTNLFDFNPKYVARGLLALLRDKVSDLIENTKDFNFIIKNCINNKIEFYNLPFKQLIEQQKKLHQSLKGEFEKSTSHVQSFIDKIDVQYTTNDQTLFSSEYEIHSEYNCKIVLDHQREKFRFYRENPIEDHQIINHFIKNSTLNLIDISNEKSLITEVNGFRTKKLLDKFKMSFHSTLDGNDVIDSNTLFSKYIGSVMMDQKSEDIIKQLFEDKMSFIKTHTLQKDIEASFTDLEQFIYEKNETLIGYISYDYKNLGTSLINFDFENEQDQPENETIAKKLKEIVINPDQDQILSLKKGDKLITIANYNFYEQYNDRNARLL
jgi:hypothetical protein